MNVLRTAAASGLIGLIIGYGAPARQVEGLARAPDPPAEGSNTSPAPTSMGIEVQRVSRFRYYRSAALPNTRQTANFADFKGDGSGGISRGVAVLAVEDAHALIAIERALSVRSVMPGHPGGQIGQFIVEPDQLPERADDPPGMVGRVRASLPLQSACGIVRAVWMETATKQYIVVGADLEDVFEQLSRAAEQDAEVAMTALRFYYEWRQATVVGRQARYRAAVVAFPHSGHPAPGASPASA